MKPIATMFLILTMTLASACAPKMWIRQDTTKDQFFNDRDHCQLVSASSSAGNPLIQASAFKHCMKGRGYNLGKAPR